MPSNWVTVGTVIKPHGLRGEVVVHALSDVDDRFAAGTPMRVGGRDTKVVASRPHQGRILVQFTLADDRTAAEQLRGARIEAEPIDTSAHETYFAHELVGMPVVDDEGADLGRVVALVELPASAEYDLLEVSRADGTVWLLPAVDDFVHVETIDGALGLRVIDPPAGLLDLNADSGGG